MVHKVRPARDEPIFFERNYLNILVFSIIGDEEKNKIGQDKIKLGREKEEKRKENGYGCIIS